MCDNVMEPSFLAATRSNEHRGRVVVSAISAILTHYWLLNSLSTWATNSRQSNADTFSGGNEIQLSKFEARAVFKNKRG